MQRDDGVQKINEGGGEDHEESAHLMPPPWPLKDNPPPCFFLHTLHHTCQHKVHGVQENLGKEGKVGGEVEPKMRCRLVRAELAVVLTHGHKCLDI